MTFSLATRLAAEFFGTAIMIILGNGSVADVELKGTKGTKSGWITISVGYGFAVMIPALDVRLCFRQPHQPGIYSWLGFCGRIPMARSTSIYRSSINRGCSWSIGRMDLFQASL